MQFLPEKKYFPPIGLLGAGWWEDRDHISGVANLIKGLFRQQEQ